MADATGFTKEAVEAFLTEYEALCRKWNLIIDACGCCESPYPQTPNLPRNASPSIEEHIKHLREFDNA